MRSYLHLAAFLLAFHSVTGFAIIAPATLSTFHIKKDGRVIATAIQLKGGIAPPLAEEIEAIFNEIEPGQKIILDLNSPGGYTSEGYKIIEIIDSQRSKHQIDSYVANGAVCASMCVPIYVQGQEKVAGPASAFMLHGVSTWYSNSLQPEETERYVNALLERNVSSQFIQSLKLLGVFAISADYWANGQKLFDERTGIVDKLSPALIINEPWSAPFDPNIRPR